MFFGTIMLAWGNAKQSILNRTVVLQTRAIKITRKVQYSSHTEPLFKKLEIKKNKHKFEYETTLLWINIDRRNYLILLIRFLILIMRSRVDSQPGYHQFSGILKGVIPLLLINYLYLNFLKYGINWVDVLTMHSFLNLSWKGGEKLKCCLAMLVI